MRIGLFTNFAQPFHTGGAEKVVQQIAESLVNEFGDECFIFPQHGNRKITHNNVDIIPIGNLSDEAFIKIVLSYNLDHIFIYSDWYFKLYALLKNIDQMRASISIIPVGFNRFSSSLPHNQVLANLFAQNKNKIKVAVHSDNYKDAWYCKKNDINFQVIPNGIDLREFKNSNTALFKEKYNITANNMLLCVANFFPGKGHEHLLKIVQELQRSVENFQLVVVSTTLHFALGNKLRDNFINEAKKLNLPIINLVDIPRRDVISAFYEADVFVFPSEQEVSPLVLLESMASRTPWISMDIGNASELRGGFCVQAKSDIDGKKIFDGVVLRSFVQNIENIIKNSEIRNNLIDDGYQQIIKYYNWEKIKYQYKELFHAKDISCNVCI